MPGDSALLYLSQKAGKATVHQHPAMRNGPPNVVAQVIVRQSPILQDSAFTKKTDGNIAMARATKGAVKGLENTRQPRGPRFSRVKLFTERSMLRKIGEAPKHQCPLPGQRGRRYRRCKNAHASVWPGKHLQLQLAALMRKNDVMDFSILDDPHPAGQAIHIKRRAQRYQRGFATDDGKNFITYRLGPGRRRLMSIQRRIFEVAPWASPIARREKCLAGLQKPRDNMDCAVKIPRR
jgi:hypothetical protein